jgi:hypothetical protein
MPSLNPCSKEQQQQRRQRREESNDNIQCILFIPPVSRLSPVGNSLKFNTATPLNENFIIKESWQIKGDSFAVRLAGAWWFGGVGVKPV